MSTDGRLEIVDVGSILRDAGFVIGGGRFERRDVGVMLVDAAVRLTSPTRLVWPTGARPWVLRYQIRKRRRDMGLGPYPEITLARAREKALEARRLAKEPLYPVERDAKAHARGVHRAAQKVRRIGSQIREAALQVVQGNHFHAP